MIRIEISEYVTEVFSEKEWQLIAEAACNQLEIDREMLEMAAQSGDYEMVEDLAPALMDGGVQEILHDKGFWERLNKLKI